jgi:Uroporphyrinogen-III decarboxylase
MAKVMTPKERETALLNGEKPDRMPIWQINGIVGAKYYGHDWKDVRLNTKLAAKITLDFAKISGTDTMAHMALEPNIMFMDLPGVEVKLPDDNYSNVMSHYYNEPEDIDKKPLYDPRNKKEAKYLYEGILDRTKLISEMAKDRIIQQFSWSVMTTAGFLRNVEQLLMDVLLEEELAHKVMAKSAELVDGVIRVGLENGCGAAYLPDPTSSGSLISGDTLRDFVGAHLTRMIGSYKKEFDAPTYIHVCGETAPVAAEVAKLGGAVYSFDYMTDIKEIRSLMGDKMILAAHLNPMDVVWQGNPKLVIETSKKCIDESEGLPFILATGCETPRDTPLANLQAMVTAVEKYATY